MPLEHPSCSRIEDIEAVTLESDLLKAVVVPAVGGRVISLIHKPTGHEFLWRNPNLRLAALSAGSEYDPNFYGGIDELLPNDLPETVDGVDLPDHGELWTTPLDYREFSEVSGSSGRGTTIQLFPWRFTREKIPYEAEIKAVGIELTGILPRSQLRYERRMSLTPDSLQLISAYRITNQSDRRQPVLWKLHAALNIAPGDRILCPAKTARVVDPQYTRWKTLEPFAWPNVDSCRADEIPENDGTVDFLYLYDLEKGRIAWERPGAQIRFEYQFDPEIFPFAWYFGSYGGFLSHYTAVLEPCSAMPISVNDAAESGKCLWLEPNEEVSTTISIYAGPTCR